jgi:HAD superfamily hydrolase (TIGR01509 family)
VRLARPLALLCDMDGLLLDTEWLVRDAMMAELAAMGLDFDPARFALLIGEPADASLKRLNGWYGDNFDSAALRRQVAARIEATWGKARPIKPGVAELLTLARSAGIKLAVATSSDRADAQSHLAHSGLADWFEAIVTRDDVARGKPSPDLYLAAARRLGVAPAMSLALEDSHNGVRAAHAAGVPVIMVPDLLPATPEMATMAVAVAADLHVVAEWLDRAM